MRAYGLTSYLTSFSRPVSLLGRFRVCEAYRGYLTVDIRMNIELAKQLGNAQVKVGLHVYVKTPNICVLKQNNDHFVHNS